MLLLLLISLSRAITFAGNKAVDVGDPVLDTDAATKNYVDTTASVGAFKAKVGTFTAVNPPQQQTVTGIGFAPKYLQLTALHSDVSVAYYAIGHSDGTNQFSVALRSSAATKTTVKSSTRIIDYTGIKDHYATLVSFGAEGNFTLTFGGTVDYPQDYAYVCFG